MRLPRAFAAATALPSAPPSLAPFGVTVSGPGWKLVSRCTMEKQKETKWCWAAVGQCVERHFQTTNPSQCEVAQRFTGLPCCSVGTNCNKVEELEILLTDFGHLRPPVEGPLDFDEIVDDIEANDHPICCFIRRSPNNHFVTIAGYRDTAGKKQLAILDPAAGGPPEEHDYDAFAVEFKNGTWEATMLTE